MASNKMWGSRLYIFFHLVLLSAVSFEQVDTPGIPILYKVTVDPTTGNDSIIWYSSSSANVDYYVIGLSIVSNPNDPYLVDSIDFVLPPDTFYVNQNSESSLHSIGYTVFAVNIVSGGIYQGDYDYPDSTIFTVAEFDSCTSSITVNWNDYNTWRGDILQYRVYEVINGGVPQLMAIVSEGINSHTISSVSENTQLGYFIEAIHKDNKRVSRSNITEVFTAMLRNPVYITADNAMPGKNNNITLSFSIDPDTELSSYKILRSTSLTGIFDTIATVQTSEKIINFIDEEVSYSSTIYYYQLLSLNSCGRITQRSNIINNIVLNGETNGMINNLNWNNIDDWNGELDHYVLYRQNMDDISFIDSFLLSDQTNFSDDLTGFFSNNTSNGGRFCYRIKAVERNNPVKNNNIALSNEMCLTVTPDIKIPNAFIPNNPNDIDNRLRPIFLFEPERYELIIYNRWGNKIWEGTEPWDGKTKGKYVAEGVYMYYLKVFNYNEKPIEKTGHVTVIYR